MCVYLGGTPGTSVESHLKISARTIASICGLDARWRVSSSFPKTCPRPEIFRVRVFTRSGLHTTRDGTARGILSIPDVAPVSHTRAKLINFAISRFLNFSSTCERCMTFRCRRVTESGGDRLDFWEPHICLNIYLLSLSIIRQFIHGDLRNIL